MILKNKKAYVIGGGPLGIGVSTKLLENDFSVVLIESSDRLLGLASTFRLDQNEIEKYYHFFYKNDHYHSENWLKKFSSDKPLISWRDISTDSIVDGVRYNLDSPIDIIKLCKIETLKVVYNLFKLLVFKPSQKLDNLTAKNWAIKSFGLNFASKVWIPLLEDKFGKNSNEISALWLATRIKRHLSTRGKGVGKSKFGYLVGTYEPYVNKFKEYLYSKNGNIILNESVVKFEVIDKTITKIITSKNKYNTEKSFVFSTLSFSILKNLFKKKTIKGLEYFQNVGVITCVLISKTKLSDHYWTTVSDSNFEFSAIIQQNRLFQNTPHEIIYLSRYCHSENEIFIEDDEIIFKKWINSLNKIFDFFNEEDIINYKVFKSKNAAPIPFLNSNKAIKEIKSDLKNFYFSGYELIFPEDRGVGNSINLGNELYSFFKSQNNF